MSVSVKLRLSERQYAQVSRAAATAGLTVDAYVLKVLLEAAGISADQR